MSSSEKYLVSLYIDNQLSKEQEQEVLEHLLQCSRCRKIYDEFVALQKLLARLEEDVAILEAAYETRLLTTGKLLKDDTEAAFVELYKRFWAKLKKMCFVYYIPESEHEALMSDVYIKVFSKIDSIHPERFADYITASMRNRIINYISMHNSMHNIRPEIIPLDSDSDETKHILDTVGENPTQIDEIDNKLIKKLICLVLEGLKKRERDIILLILVEGHSYKETAEILDINPISVGPRLFMARMKFISYFKRHYKGWYNELSEKIFS